MGYVTLWKRIESKLKKFPTGKQVYDAIQPAAEGVKASIQVVIGITGIIILAIQVCLHLSEDATALGNLALAIIGVALAFSATVELAYTFFTDGPDEALDPLILGLSSFTLIEISRSSAHLKNVAIPVLLLAAAIFVLFIARKYLVEIRKPESPDAENGNNSDTPSEPSIETAKSE